ncbi:hypothetical protein FSP39_025362 [Pinctada imbricata]|uniref:Rad50/SbcC-type AAA domain-containing protein n=1 Tax=Pinctada imbricata TaxID=66713 RepID=A0AA88XXT0_PINIB|nr:hypothetical protein FSP39_025362 [Pinctada imbricata]
MKIRGFTISYASYKKKQRNINELKLIEETEELEKTRIDNDEIEQKKGELEALRQDKLQGLIIRSKSNWVEQEMSKRKHPGDEDVDDDSMDLSQAELGNEKKEAEIGIVEKVSLKNFMCHSRLDVKLGGHVNFIIGRNGSGKSAIVTALVVGLGGKASACGRGNAVKSLIKTGKQTAEVEIVLRNRGPDAFKHNAYGDAIIVNRKFTADGGSHYKIKSKTGRVVTTKREELTNITDQFNIQVDNPVSILNQDTSRNFLNSKNSNDKYKFFLKATQLEQMKLDYSRANEQKEVTKVMIEKKKESLPNLATEVLKLEQQFKSLTAVNDLKAKMKKHKEEMAWAFVIAKERALVPMQKEHRYEEDRLPAFKKKVDESKAKEDDCVKRHKAIQEELKRTSEEVNVLRPQFDEAKKDLNEKKKNARSAQIESRKIENHLRKLTQEREDIKAKIKDLQKTAQTDFNSEKKKQEANIQSLEQFMEANEAQKQTTEHDMEKFRGAVTKLKNDEYKLNAELQSLRSREEKTKKQLNAIQAARNNKIKRFGAHIPTLLQHIEEQHRKGRFTQKPIGPLGACIQLRDPEWALGVECCLGNLMHSFCCHNHKDERVLEGIFDKVCQSNKRPSIIVSGFKRPQTDRFNTVFETLEISNPVVANCLIDQRGIESILLIPEGRDAREFMDPDNSGGPPRGCNEAFTMRGDQVFSSPSLRFYSSNQDRSRFLSANVEEEISRLQEDLSTARSEIQKLDRDQRQFIDEINKNKWEEKRAETQLMKINEKIRELKNEIYELKSIEDPVPVDVSTLEEEVDNLTEQISKVEILHGEKSAKYSEVENIMKESDKRFKDVEQAMRQKAEVGEPLKDDLGRVQLEIEQAKSHKKHYEQTLKEQEKKVGELKKKMENYGKEIESERKRKLVLIILQSDTEKAKKIKPDRINTRRSVQNLESEICQIEKQIKTEEKSRGDPEEITRKYHDKKEAYMEIQREVGQCNTFLSHLQRVMVHRQQQYSELRRLIAMRAKYFFIVLLANRNYTGKMKFNHVKETLEMSVQPHVTQEEGAKDLRSLSGGERSFSTVCFILSLWDAMEAPFRCLDEFDVFMDMVNRRISMDMMLKVAENQPQRQFIFLTPQNMSQLGIHTASLNIFRMPDPDRGSGVLPFRRSANQEDEEDE